MSAVNLILGDDGRGYELARRLDLSGVWRAWLGESSYASFAHHLVSPAAWDAFLSPSIGNSNGTSSSSARPLLSLQLRVRALLFDKASAAFSIDAGELGGGVGPHALNPAYLQLHGDDMYYILEDERDDGSLNHNQSRSAFSPSKDSSNAFQRHRHDELLDSWSKQYGERLKSKRLKFPSTGRETTKRTPEGMCAYVQLCNIHKRRRVVFEEHGAGTSVSRLGNGSSLHSKNPVDLVADDTFIPEIMFPSDCIPDSALPVTRGIEKSSTDEVYGVLDKLPELTSRSTAMLERFGMAPEYYKVGNKYRGRSSSSGRGISLSQEQAFVMTKQLVARFLSGFGFQSGTATSIEVLSEIVSKHISKLGRILKLLTDSYRKQYSSIELLRMFLQTTGFSNIGVLTEGAKAATRLSTNQLQDMQSFQPQQQTVPVHQVQRQMQPYMSLAQSQNLAFQQQPHQLIQQQQQWDKVRRKQLVSPHGQPPVTVKVENTADTPMDGPYSSVNYQAQMRHQQLQQQLLLQQQMQQQQPQQQQQQIQQQQFQQQQMAMAQAGQQFKQQSMQMPQVHLQNTYGTRMPVVKVEALPELHGEDTATRREPNKLASASK